MSEQEQIPFDLEKFKAGMKAKWGKQLIKYTYTATNGFICFEFEAGDPSYSALKHLVNAATMVSRHQHLIDSYNPEDTWQEGITSYGNLSRNTYTIWLDIDKPNWDEGREYRLHPHNDLIKAFKSGKEIIATNTDGNEIPLYRLEDLLNPYKDWDDLRIKTDPEFTYPIYKQSKYSGVVVEFTDLTTGKVVGEGASYKIGHVQSIWIPHTDAAQWQDWTPTNKSKPITHCLAYDASLDPNPKLWGPPVVSEKQFAVKKSWYIIQEWEV